MVSSSVRTMSFLNSQAVSTRKEISMESRTDDFAKMMDESINKAKNTEAKYEVKTETKVEEKSEIKENEFDKNYNETVENDKDVEAVEMEDITEEESVSEEVSEEILNVVAAVLNISVEDLKAAIEKLGMEGKDLLDVENVTKLVMDLKNIDNKLELLVHEDANNIIKDIQKSITELMESVEISKDELTDVKDFVVEENVADKFIATDEETVDVENIKQVDNLAEQQLNETDNANSETSFSGEESEGEELSKSEKAESAINGPLNELTDSVLKEIEVALEERVDEVTATRMVREIADNITVAIREKLTSLEMQLNPESLGKVTVLLATEEGGITAKITAETEMAKNAIEQQLTILKDNFEKQGLKVTDIEVTIASHGFEQNLDKNDSKNEGQQKKNNRIRQGLLDELNGVVKEEQETEDIMKQALGNTVSYLA